jgi:hypothetical protein
VKTHRKEELLAHGAAPESMFAEFARKFVSAKNPVGSSITLNATL